MCLYDDLHALPSKQFAQYSNALLDIVHSVIDIYRYWYSVASISLILTVSFSFTSDTKTRFFLAVSRHCNSIINWVNAFCVPHYNNVCVTFFIFISLPFIVLNTWFWMSLSMLNKCARTRELAISFLFYFVLSFQSAVFCLDLRKEYCVLSILTDEHRSQVWIFLLAEQKPWHLHATNKTYR